MYFVQRGVCEVVEESTGAVLFVLEEGSYFGEIALLVSERRTASVRTATVRYVLLGDNAQWVAFNCWRKRACTRLNNLI